jgi:hypothetical protein
VNAGSGAERVVVDGVGVLVEVVRAGVVALRVVFGVAVLAVCETGGTLDAVTVFVPDPQAVSSAPAQAHSATVEIARRAVGFILRMVFAPRTRPPCFGGRAAAGATGRAACSRAIYPAGGRHEK